MSNNDIKSALQAEVDRLKDLYKRALALSITANVEKLLADKSPYIRDAIDLKHTLVERYRLHINYKTGEFYSAQYTCKPAVQTFPKTIDLGTVKVSIVELDDIDKYDNITTSDLTTIGYQVGHIANCIRRAIYEHSKTIALSRMKTDIFNKIMDMTVLELENHNLYGTTNY